MRSLYHESAFIAQITDSVLRLEAYLRNVDAKNSEASGEKKKIKAIYYALQ